MPKGTRGILKGDHLSSFQCPCMETPLLFKSEKRFDMFMKLHKKVCEQFKNAPIQELHCPMNKSRQECEISLEQKLYLLHK